MKRMHPLPDLLPNWLVRLGRRTDDERHAGEFLKETVTFSERTKLGAPPHIEIKIRCLTTWRRPNIEEVPSLLGSGPYKLEF